MKIATKKVFLSAMEGRILVTAELTGRDKRGGDGE